MRKRHRLQCECAALVEHFVGEFRTGMTEGQLREWLVSAYRCGVFDSHDWYLDKDEYQAAFEERYGKVDEGNKLTGWAYTDTTNTRYT